MEAGARAKAGNRDGLEKAWYMVADPSAAKRCARCVVKKSGREQTYSFACKPFSCHSKLTWLVLGGDPAARSHRVEQFTAL